MATTSAGNPYVESSDLVANYPATSLALANRLDKYALNPFADAAARDAAIPTPVQGQLAQTLDDNKSWRYDGTAWAPFSGAVGAANFTDTATGTYTDASGQQWKFLNFSGTSSVTIDTAGLCDLLIVAGGGSGGSVGGAGGGAGGLLYIQDAFLSAATHVVQVGAGGAGNPAPTNQTGQTGSSGNASRIADYYSPGGGAGAGGSSDVASTSYLSQSGLSGGAGGGCSAQNDPSGGGGIGGSGLLGLGGDGGSVGGGIVLAAAGGGGAATGSTGNGVSPAVSYNGGDGGAGRSVDIRGTAVFFCGGGGGSGQSSQGGGGSGIGGAAASGIGGAGTGGTGSGGGGSESVATGSTGGNGGAGTITIRVKV